MSSSLPPSAPEYASLPSTTMAAVDVFTLLSLPASKAFSAFRSSEFGVEQDSRARPAAADNTRNGSEKSASVVLKLKGPALKVQSNDVYDRDLALVRRAIRVVLAKGTTETMPATYEKIYAACRAVVQNAQNGEGVYEYLKMEMERCFGSLLRELLETPHIGVAWLQPFIETCSWFDRQVTLLKSLLAYLDRVYLVGQKKTDIGSLAYEGFYQRIFQYGAIILRIREGVAEWVTWEREQHAVHEARPLIVALVSQLQRHGLYHDILESFYLTKVHDYYVEEARKLRETLQPDEFCRHAGDRHDEEVERARDVLLESSTQRVALETDTALLTAHLDWIAKGSMEPLMDGGESPALEHLHRMYLLFSAVGGIKVLLAAFKAYVTNFVKKIVTDVKMDEQMVDRLLILKRNCDAVVTESFYDEEPIPRVTPSKPSGSADVDAGPSVARRANREFGYAVTDAFADGFKARRNKPAEMIAKHLDRAMRRGQKGRDDRAYGAELAAALALYRFTDDKDVFRTFYHRALAKRLLLEKSASDDHEKAMLRKLKEEYDPEFGMGDHMFTDLALSRDLTAEYRARKGGDAKLSLMVLQRSVWPFTARTQDVVLPVWMTDELNKFTEFYGEKHKGRKLDWDHSLGHATLRAHFKAGVKELTVSLYQAVVLLLFNEAEELSFRELKAQSSMEDGELRRTLQSLALGKKRVLRKQPAGKDVHDEDVFAYNGEFTDAAFRVHINSIQVRESAEEAQRAQTMIEADRKYALDAAVVRIMKGRKKLHYEQLKTQTVEAVAKHFHPEVSMIKARIDGLVEQEYLRRDDDDMNVLHYVA
ncbi:cullin-domain-containing protein [Phanerochaete sordida]|uniref:Cullin-domain-containing protein n=1 Tax=Phanerochaete sordida TaxID=48140 RepID=A0A9P3GE46_9APHY|nr:cullin-domain-containing protein [Phanerochaete sordida]